MPRTHLALTVFLFSMFLLVSTGFAEQQGFSATISPKNISLNISGIGQANITVTNSQNTVLNFFISIKGAYPKSIFFDSGLLSLPNSTTTQKINFNPVEGIGRFPIVFYGEDLGNSSINFSIPVNLWVQHPDKYIIKAVKYTASGTTATGSITLQPDDKRQTDIVFDISDINQKVVKSATLSRELESEITLDQPLDISDLPAGKYKLRISIKGTSLSDSTSFDIGLSRGISVDRQTTQGLLYDEVKILLSNSGNLPETRYVFYEDVPNGKSVKLLTNATDVLKTGTGTKYEFTINEIRPGEVATIVYRIDKSQSVLAILLGAVVLLGLLGMAFSIAKKPKIKKRFIKSGKGQYSIVLELKNSGFTSLNDSVVKDFVQPLAKVKSDNSSGMAPHTRQSQLGTELVWKVGPLKRGESRLLHYSLDAPMVESLKLSHASLDYVTSRNGKGSVKSNELVLD